MFDGDGYNKRGKPPHTSLQNWSLTGSEPNSPTIAKFLKRSEKNFRKPKLSKLLNVFLPNVQSNERYKGWGEVGWGAIRLMYQ